MHDDLSSDAHFFRNRQRLLVGGFTVIALAVTTLAAWRLSMPLADSHLAVNKDGKVGNKTMNPFGGIAGSIQLRDGTPIALNFADTANDRTRKQTSDALLIDIWAKSSLAAALEPALKAGMQSFVRQMPDSDTPVGRRLELSLEPKLQALMSATAKCFIGKVEYCSGNLPPSMLRPGHRFGDSAKPRAGMAAYIVVAEATGAVIAKGGDLSNCAKKNLQRKAVRNGPNDTRVFASDAAQCPQWPDILHRDWLGFAPMNLETYLALRPGQVLTDAPKYQEVDPSDWALNPGSINKVPLAIACTQTGGVWWNLDAARQQFAISSNNDFFKGLSLQCVEHYREVYRHVVEPVALLHPSKVLVSGYPGWRLQPVPLQLPGGAILPAKRYLEIDGVQARNLKKTFKLTKAERQGLHTSRDLSTIAIGDGGAKGFLASHARLLRLIGLASLNDGRKTAAPSMYVARDLDEPIATEDLGWLPDAKASQSVLHLLSGVTAAFDESHWGTAHEACQLVAAPCPAKGLENFYGKTGTSDVNDESARSFVKKTSMGDPMPDKLFVARFKVADKWYVVATQTLRSRDPRTGNLDRTNAAAELGLIARFHLLNLSQSTGLLEFQRS